MSDPMRSMEGNLEERLINYRDEYFRDTVDVLQVWKGIREQAGRQEPQLQSELDLQRRNLSHTIDVGHGEGAHTRSAHASYASTPPTNVWEWALDEIKRPLLDEKQAEVDMICEQLQREETRLLTLIGPPGIGKTRLALEAAIRLLDSFSADFPDGVFFVSLATTATTARDHNLVVPTIVQTLGITEVRENDETDEKRVAELLACLKNTLRDKRMLLLLDRFDRVEGAEKVVAELLEGTTFLKVLVTKVDKLGVEGETWISVQPLALPGPSKESSEPLTVFQQYGSVRLLSNEIRAVDSDFVITPENRETIAEICRLLAGLPLAIQLVASHVRDTSLQDILRQLNESDPIFSANMSENGELTIPDPREILTPVIDWSYKRLDPERQALYRRIGIFWGGRTLESIRAVCFPSSDLSTEDLIARVNSLVEMKLLQPYEGARPYASARGEQRYWMREPIHNHARERLESSGESKELQQRHADYFLAFVENAEAQIERFPDQRAKWWARLKNELENIRKALRQSQDDNYDDRKSKLVHAMSWVLQQLGTDEFTLIQQQPVRGRQQRREIHHNVHDKEFILAQMQVIAQAREGVSQIIQGTEELTKQQKELIKIQMQIIACATESINIVMGDATVLKEHGQAEIGSRR